MEPLPCFFDDVGEGSASAGRNGRGNGTFNERSRGEDGTGCDLLVQKIERHFGTHHGTSDVDEHDHAVSLIGRPNRSSDLGRVGAEGFLIDARRDGNPNLRASHLSKKGHERLREGAAVRHENDTNHENGG